MGSLYWEYTKKFRIGELEGDLSEIVTTSFVD